jgi:hypothetical protein
MIKHYIKCANYHNTRGGGSFKKLAANIPNNLYLKFKQTSSHKKGYSKGYTGSCLTEAVLYWLVIQKLLEYYGEQVKIIENKKWSEYDNNGRRHMTMNEAVKLFIEANKEYLD